MGTASFHTETLSTNCCLIRTSTVLDNSNADEFASLIMDLYNSAAVNLVIDMAELEFLSSAGVGSILGTVELFRDRDGDIILTNIGEKIMSVLKVLDLAEYLTICSTSEEAAARCGM